MREFEADREWELLRLRDELVSGAYRPGPYRTFIVHEKVERLISAAPYRDRVVHHALMNVAGPVLERGLVSRTFANRIGYGTHRAWALVKQWARQHAYCLKLDLEKYFPSIDHAILKDRVRRRIRCPRTLALIDLIIDCSNEQPEIIRHFPGDTLFTPLERRRGLPIGNLTSQYLANFYLDEIDHLIMERLGFTRYARYMDDLVVFDNTRERLIELRAALEAPLAALRLAMHPRKTRIIPCRAGVPFLGYVAFADRARLDGGNVRRMRRKLRAMRAACQAGQLPVGDLVTSYRAWVAHAAHADTMRLRRTMFCPAYTPRAALPGFTYGAAHAMMPYESDDLPGPRVSVSFLLE